MLRRQLVLKDEFKALNLIAGCDMAIDPENNWAYAGVIVYEWPSLREVERRAVKTKLTFPYIPGLLSFREAPALLRAISKLKSSPDLFIFDGQGTAHPRGIGIASHMGLWLDRPTIGCAKSRLIGRYKEPREKFGSYESLFSEEGKILGVVFRTRDSVRPVFISQGHKVSLRTSIDLIKKCCDGYRIPKPTREADHYVEAFKRKSRRDKK